MNGVLHAGRPDLAPGGLSAAPLRALHAVGLSGLRAEGGGRDGLYLHPPKHAVVVAVDEKTAIQALDRLDPVLPLSPGRAERHGFEYYRHGTLSLYAALNTTTGEIIGQTVPRHTSAAFVDFLGDVVAPHPRRDHHVIIDNLAAHKTKGVQAFLTRTRASTCISRLRTRPGSTRWNFGSTRSSAISSLAASSRRSPTLRARSAATSRATTRIPNRSAGPTATRRVASLPIQLLQPTRGNTSASRTNCAASSCRSSDRISSRGVRFG